MSNIIMFQFVRFQTSVFAIGN